jgi:hypothetical protein
VSGHGHDRAGAVVREDVVGDVDRQALAVHRVHRVQSGGDAGLLDCCGALLGLLRRGAADVRLDVLRLDPGDEVVLGCDDEVGRAEERVRPGREDGHVLAPLLDPEVDLSAFGAADPVPLACLDRLGPVYGLEVVQQRVRVVGDAEEPLLHQSRLDEGAAALARSIR